MPSEFFVWWFGGGESIIVYCKANTDMLYCRHKKGTTAHKVVDLMMQIEIPPRHSVKV
jgi:hypothetical protein